MAQVTHLALDGSRHEFSAGPVLDRPFTSVADLDVDGHRHELTAGPTGLGEEVVAALRLPGFTEELDHADGTLRIASGGVTDPRTGLRDAVTVAAWYAAGHCLVASMYNATTTDVLRLLAAVRPTQHRLGIALAPTAGVAVVRVHGLKEVPGLGLLEVSARTRDAVRELPDWSGLALPSGELFRDTLSTGRAYYVLVTPSAVVTVLPMDGGALTDDTAARLLGSLRVEVRTGSRL